MNHSIVRLIVAVVLGIQSAAVGQQPATTSIAGTQWVRRCGQIAPVANDRLAEFTRLASEPPEDLAAVLAAHGFRNHSLFVKHIAPDAPYAFRFVEYAGNRLMADARRLADEPRYRAWNQALEECLQSPWVDVEEVFYWRGRVDVSVPPNQVQYHGQAVGLRPEMAEAYRLLHAHPWPGVLAKITEGNIRNYAIYWGTVDSRMYLFAYFEYVGRDYAADMAAIDADATTQAWIKFTDQGCQLPLATRRPGEWWAEMDRLATVVATPP